MSDTIKALNALLDGRYSCRGFLKDEIPHDTIEAIVTHSHGNFLSVRLKKPKR